jgi:hypothetical protein
MPIAEGTLDLTDVFSGPNIPAPSAYRKDEIGRNFDGIADEIRSEQVCSLKTKVNEC